MAKLGASTEAEGTCSICGKKLSRKSDLPRHMKLHAPDKKKLEHACPYVGCGFSSLQKSNLKTHLNTHTGERPHKCPAQGCEFSSPDPASLNRHRKNIHGHRANGKSKSARLVPSRTPKTSRQQRKFSPYQSSSSSGSATPSTPTSDAYYSAEAPFPRILECGPSSPFLSADEYVESSRHTSAAYGTALIHKHPQVHLNDPEFAFANDAYPLTLDSGVFTGSEASAELSQLLAHEQKEPYGFDATSQPVFDMTGSGGPFDNFYAQFNSWVPDGELLCGGSSYSTSMVKHGVDSAQLPTLASLSPETYEDQYSVGPASLPTPTSWTLPAYEAQYPANTAPSYTFEGCATQGTSFANFSQAESFATPDMGMGIYAPSQPLVNYPLANRDYFYGANNYYDTSTSGDLTIQGLFL